MTLEELRRFARWAEKIAEADKQLATELATALKEAEASVDPLGLFIYQARARYRRTQQADKSKDGKSIERELDTTYVDAMKLGFRGSHALWRELMRMGKSAAQMEREKEESRRYGNVL